ncbi:TM2 domain-containing protein [Mycoplasmopsis columbinasalis]|uniref:TM2 domain n=1 Tax=Mycoplasmopsis columbinasalis TaxID=114880 RepID=A0A449BAN6_9BACT|nr:TM2 domain-containing protein [Mycoplasmopsis columbinasalis]VEU78264.1 TM2 domain [Mycoplasmopsis columbinasalis]
MSNNIVRTQAVSNKSRLLNLLLAIFFGQLGIDRFYVGRVGFGLVKLLTLGCFGILWLLDICLAAAGKTIDKHGGAVSKW